MVLPVKVNASVKYACIAKYKYNVHNCLQISMSVTWIMLVMKGMDCALIIMEVICVAVKWGSDLMATDSTVVVSQFSDIL